jgi:HNH endonuclease
MRGYVAEPVRQRVREAAGDRCGYCLSHQRYLLGPLEIEHLVPLVRGGTDDEDNLWLACARCNRFKGGQIEARDPVTGEVSPLYNPRTQRWRDHFRWDADGTTIAGLTAVGRATIAALRLNHEHSIAVRRNWVAAGWHPPAE